MEEIAITKGKLVRWETNPNNRTAKQERSLGKPEQRKHRNQDQR